MLTEKLIRDFVMLWATIDPIGTLSLFAALTASKTITEQRRIAIKAVMYSALILFGFIVLGQVVLSAMQISLPAFQIAGGLVLFLFGLQMIFSGSGWNSAESESGHDIAVFPLAVPSIASPGAIMAVTVLTDNHRFGVVDQVLTAGVMVTVLAITGLMMLAANSILRVMGNNGAAILVKVMGMILTALAVETVLQGYELYQAAAAS